MTPLGLQLALCTFPVEIVMVVRSKLTLPVMCKAARPLAAVGEHSWPCSQLQACHGYDGGREAPCKGFDPSHEAGQPVSEWTEAALCLWNLGRV